MFVACGIWCLADVSSVSPSSEQTGQTHIQRTRPRRKTVFFKTSLPVFVCLSVCLPVCLPAFLPVCLFVCLFVCLSVCLSACLSVCLSVHPSFLCSACLPSKRRVVYKCPCLSQLFPDVYIGLYDCSRSLIHSSFKDWEFKLIQYSR